MGRGYYVDDPRGNMVQMLDGSAQVKATFGYDPFGKEKANLTTKSGSWDSRLKFQKAPQDPLTKSYAIGPRMYNSDVYRFVGSDSFVAASANLALQIDPLTGNRYIYAGSNPANLIDDGHSPKWLRKAVSSAVGFAAKTGAAWLFSKEARVEMQDKLGNAIFRGPGWVSKLSANTLGAVSSGVGAAVTDAYQHNLSGVQRAGRVALAAGISAGVGVGVAAVCAATAGGGCAPAVAFDFNFGGVLVARTIASRAYLGQWLHVGEGF